MQHDDLANVVTLGQEHFEGQRHHLRFGAERGEEEVGFCVLHVRVLCCRITFAGSPENAGCSPDDESSG